MMNDPQNKNYSSSLKKRSKWLQTGHYKNSHFYKFKRILVQMTLETSPLMLFKSTKLVIQINIILHELQLLYFIFHPKVKNRDHERSNQPKGINSDQPEHV